MSIKNDKKDPEYELTYGRIEKARKDLAKVLTRLEGISEQIEFACERAGWDSSVAYQIREAASQLGFALGTLTIWSDEED